MNLLFIHPSSPGQFEFLSTFLANDSSHRVAFLCKTLYQKLPNNIIIKKYQANRDGIEPLKACLIEAEAVFFAIKELENENSFKPDIIVGHSGWGSLLYARAACPTARIIGYFEWYYCMNPAFEGAWFLGRTDEEISVILTQRNAALLSQMESCDGMFTPTRWQQSGFPTAYRQRIQVMHEGVDTDYFYPNKTNTDALAEIIPGISGKDEIVTMVSRGLEPTRCFPLFMDAVRKLLVKRPHCHVVIVGKENTYYGSKPGNQKSWKQQEIEKGGFDPARVHFTGWLTKDDYRSVLWASTVHVYLTLPFILSWSMLQAMSTGCCLVASDVQPVKEVVEEGVNGLLVDISSPDNIVSRIEEALSDKSLRERLATQARKTILERYKLEDCLNKQIDFLEIRVRDKGFL